VPLVAVLVGGKDAGWPTVLRFAARADFGSASMRGSPFKGLVGLDGLAFSAATDPDDFAAKSPAARGGVVRPTAARSSGASFVPVVSATASVRGACPVELGDANEGDRSLVAVSSTRGVSVGNLESETALRLSAVFVPGATAGLIREGGPGSAAARTAVVARCDV